MKTESIYKVTMIDGPQTSIMPIKAYDEEHAVRIAANMGLGLPLYICRVKVGSTCDS